MPQDSGCRVVFDVSTALRWTGPPVGIVRVERELALWAHAHLSNCAFVFFDPVRQAYCEILPDVTLFLRGEAAVDTLGLTSAASPGRRRTDRIPSFIRPGMLWVIQFRRMALSTLERLRLQTRHGWLDRHVDRLQRALMSRKYRKYMVRNDDTRRPFFPYDMVVGPQMDLRPADTLICAGSGWGLTNIEVLSEAKSRLGFRMVLLCYDLIPLLRPQFYRAHDVDLFRNYMHRALEIADLIIVTSRRIEEDCRTYCAGHQIASGRIVVAPLGFDVRSHRLRHVSLPKGLDSGRFVLMVSTIEPRKGHRLLYRVWRRLIDEGVVQTNGFKLVFVGRPGWMIDDLLEEIRSGPGVAARIQIINEADDDLLAALYAGAAFCVYPSEYEGYGLPIVEAFAHGKAVLASSGGALPEIVGDLSPCLDPTDDEAWYTTIKQWIESPQERVRFEQAIAQRFQHPTWSAAAANFFVKAVAGRES